MISRITDSPIFRRCVSIQVMLAALITVASISPAAAEDLFWIESINSCAQNLIRRTTVGSGVINDIKSSTTSFQSMEIDTTAGHLYWTQASNGPDLLLRSNLDGVKCKSHRSPSRWIWRGSPSIGHPARCIGWKLTGVRRVAG